jgi:hypothetical protein
LQTVGGHYVFVRGGVGIYEGEQLPSQAVCLRKHGTHFDLALGILLRYATAGVWRSLIDKWTVH